MRTLILSCSTGEGHNSCAKAVKEVYDMNGEFCVIKDILEFISPQTASLFSKGHSFIYRRMPWLFRSGYDYAERHSELFAEGTVIYRFLTKTVPVLYEYIKDNQIDSIICVHVFSALAVTDLMKKYDIILKTCFIATDYTCSPITSESCLDCYFVPDKIVAGDFLNAGIPYSKISESGIPLRQAFYSHLEKGNAKNQLHIGAFKHLVIMCGSMGCGPIEQISEKLLINVEQGWHISVICGNNTKLYKKLKQRYTNMNNISVYSYTDNIPNILSSADLLLTKPGGISTTEAAIKRVPMVLVNAVGGCEKYNSSYFINLGCARTGDTVEELIDCCNLLMRDDILLNYAKKHYLNFTAKKSANIIFEYMIADIT